MANIIKNYSIAAQKFKYFVVLDFEATCTRNCQIRPQEIIEFPSILVNGQTMEEISKFRSYIKPVHHPFLTDFCTELTGICQQDVNNAPSFSKVMADYDQWLLCSIKNFDPTQIAFITCGNWDLGKILPDNCRLFQISMPEYFKRWVNIKESFAEATKHYPKTIFEMLSILKERFDGRLHCGMDDCVNIYKIAKILALKYNHSFNLANVVRY